MIPNQQLRPRRRSRAAQPYVFEWTSRLARRSAAVRVELPRLRETEVKWLRYLLRATRLSPRDWEGV